EYQDGLAQSHVNLGMVYGATNRFKEAEQAYRDARTFFQALAEKHSAVTKYQVELARSHNNLGTLYAAAVRSKEAEQAYRDALTIHKALAEKHPTVPGYAIDLGLTQHNLGLLVNASGKPEAALTWYDQAIATLQQVPAQQPQNPTARQPLQNAHWVRAIALTRLDRHAEALKDWEEILQLDEGRYRNYFRIQRALTLARMGEH